MQALEGQESEGKRLGERRWAVLVWAAREWEEQEEEGSVQADLRDCPGTSRRAWQ